jgi:methylglutaconyl-CoA hydratase
MSLLTAVEGGVLTLTLNRPEKRNALDRATIARLRGALGDAELNPAVRVIAVCGAGEDFCAGADLAELLGSVDQSPDENEHAALDLGEVFIAMRELPKPVVAIVHGRALAGGAGLATTCDLVLAGEGAHFGYPEIQRGFVPAMVMTMLRRQVGERRAFDLVATGRMLSAREALEAGLVSRVIPDAALDAHARATLTQLAGISASALALTKKLFYELDDLGFRAGIELGARVNALARMHPDFRAAVATFLNK